MTHAEKIRDAAKALHVAIAEGAAAGLTVQWPRRADELPAIAVSETSPRPATVPVEPPKSRKKKSAPDAE